MELRFTHSEAAFTYFAATRAYLERHGKPVAFYSDKASVFRVNKPNATGGDGHTQFARAIFELNIEGICANSSQAKGRVERTHLTLQDRLAMAVIIAGSKTGRRPAHCWSTSTTPPAGSCREIFIESTREYRQEKSVFPSSIVAGTHICVIRGRH
ncbi:transposase, ISNCY family protein [Cupriavidus basilensis OR16]|uniref:Transposase, ISNCY family protein n=1 Tax=Cupriavidus basilensis OR16 TaxID=1127483 RepID=H1S1Y8_9BURK|nr:transposase, ISNCY family protein [Cupriavidus basilensis OR16]